MNYVMWHEHEEIKKNNRRGFYQVQYKNVLKKKKIIINVNVIFLNTC